MRGLDSRNLNYKELDNARAIIEAMPDEEFDVVKVDKFEAKLVAKKGHFEIVVYDVSEAHGLALLHRKRKALFELWEAAAFMDMPKLGRALRNLMQPRE